MSNRRSELQREVAEALISTKAINFEAVGSILTKYGSRAALTGDAIGAIINWRVIDICIPVDHIPVSFLGNVRNLEAAGD